MGRREETCLCRAEGELYSGVEDPNSFVLEVGNQVSPSSVVKRILRREDGSSLKNEGQVSTTSKPGATVGYYVKDNA